jgi:hypothetical protein
MPGKETGQQSPSGWCRGCGTVHKGQAPCPGSIKLDSQGEIVWQNRFETNNGETIFFITRSEWNGRWCARIFAHPNRPWSVPGGGPVIKFISDDPRDCRDDALGFLMDFCRRKGYTDPAGALAGTGEDPPVRVPQTIPLIWGTERPSTPGGSVNVSTHGMFVATDLPPDPGTVVKVRMQFGAISLPLRGSVTWNRPQSDTDQNLQAGMGVCLLSPPSIYKGFIQQFA